MADEPGTDAVSVWLRRVGPVIEVVNKVTLTTVLILIILLGVGWASGYIPLKPFEDLSAEHQVLATAQHTQATALEKLVAIIARIDRRTQIIDCAPLKDADLRKLCLQ